jgi:ElaB/YqjD/DUF883 family membrane-anchored ribosome-binding protein
MRKFTALALLSTLVLAAPAFANDTPAGVASDVQDVQKDNDSLAKTNADLAKHRVEKAKAKATGDTLGQASSSVKIGADKVKRSAHGAMKDHDKSALDSDANSAAEKGTDK